MILSEELETMSKRYKKGRRRMSNFLSFRTDAKNKYKFGYLDRENELDFEEFENWG